MAESGSQTLQDQGRSDGPEFVVFYAWQSDLQSKDNRNFIEGALEAALKNVAKGGSVLKSPRLDKDTKGVPGMPDIAATIFDKIRSADAFVADVSFVAAIEPPGPPSDGRASSERVPNPNVMLELGYALSELGWERIIPVLNSASGEPAALPFDLKNRRWPCSYRIDAETSSDNRVEVRRALTGQLEEAVRAIARLGPRRKRATAESRLDALETMVTALNRTVSDATTLQRLITELRASPAEKGPSADEPKLKCRVKRGELIQRVSAADFHKVVVQPGMFVMTICPSSIPSPFPLFEQASRDVVRGGLQPLSASSWSPKIQGDRYVALNGAGRAPEAATEINVEGIISAAGHDVMAIPPEFLNFSSRKPLEGVVPIPSVAFEKKVIEAAFEYIKVLKRLGAAGPFYVGIGLTNLGKSFLFTNGGLQFGGGAFEGDQILPEIVEVPVSTSLDNPQGVARALRPAFDYVWREHGFPRSLDYAETGDWIGGR